MLYNIYYGDWSSQEDMEKEFDNSINLNGLKILYARYSRSSYEGDCFVLLESNDGEWFEVNSSHCSCNGLTWVLEPTTRKAILYRIINGHLDKELLTIEDLESLALLV